MKRVIIIIAAFLLVVSVTICVCFENRLKIALAAYNKTVTGDTPGDIRLTIYYLPPYIVTRMPWDIDMLINSSSTKKISVESEELASRWDDLKGIDLSELTPVTENTNIDAKFHYVLETGAGSKLLEVTVSWINAKAVVNGIIVEESPVIYKLILPFLTEEDRSVLGF